MPRAGLTVEPTLSLDCPSKRSCIFMLLLGEAVHIRSVLHKVATQEDLSQVQHQNKLFLERVDGLLERLWSVQREVRYS